MDNIIPVIYGIDRPSPEAGLTVNRERNPDETQGWR